MAPDQQLPRPAWSADIAVDPGSDLWVFGYGSLMWNPGFPFAERHAATLPGYHRSFCVASHRYRGTPERPGLVLGLDRGGSCRGIVFRVAAADVPVALDYLWEREMDNRVYLPKLLQVRLRGRRSADRNALLDALRAAEIALPAGFGADSPYDDTLDHAVHAFLARTNAALAVAQLDDLTRERDQVNLPGTTDQYPNWRRKLSMTLEELADAPEPAAVAAILAAARPPSPPAGR